MGEEQVKEKPEIKVIGHAKMEFETPWIPRNPLLVTESTMLWPYRKCSFLHSLCKQSELLQVQPIVMVSITDKRDTIGWI